MGTDSPGHDLIIVFVLATFANPTVHLHDRDLRSCVLISRHLGKLLFTEYGVAVSISCAVTSILRSHPFEERFHLANWILCTGVITTHLLLYLLHDVMPMWVSSGSWCLCVGVCISHICQQLCLRRWGRDL